MAMYFIYRIFVCSIQTYDVIAHWSIYTLHLLIYYCILSDNPLYKVFITLYILTFDCMS